MTLFTKTGTVTKDTTTGAHTQNFTSELGFTPMGIIFWTEKATADGIKADNELMVGFTNGTAHRVLINTSDDGSANSAVSNISDNTTCVRINTVATTTVVAAATCTFQANGFDLVWTSANNIQYKINYFAFGGSDITNVSVQKIDIAGTGDRTYTTTGSFQGDIGFFMGTNATETTAVTSRASVSFGAAVSSSQQFTTSYRMQGAAATMDTSKTQRTDMMMRVMDGAGTVLSDGTFVAWTSTGFTLNHTVADTTDDMMCMIVKGGIWEIGSFSQATGNGVQTTNLTNSSLDPSALMLCSFGAAANTAVIDHANMSLGASDGTREICSWIGDEDAALNAIAKSDHSETKCMRLIDEIVAGGTLLAEADISSLATVGQFALNWTTTDATARQICYVVLGETAAGGAAPDDGYGGEVFNMIPQVLEL